MRVLSLQKESRKDDDITPDFEMTSAPLEELDLVSFASHVPFDELIERLESHLRHQARMPNLDERLRMAAAKAISEGRRRITDSAEADEANELSDGNPFFLMAAE